MFSEAETVAGKLLEKSVKAKQRQENHANAERVQAGAQHRLKPDVRQKKITEGAMSPARLTGLVRRAR